MEPIDHLEPLSVAQTRDILKVIANHYMSLLMRISSVALLPHWLRFSTCSLGQVVTLDISGLNAGTSCVSISENLP